MNKPRITPLPCRIWLVDFDRYRRARIREIWDMRSGSWSGDFAWDSWDDHVPDAHVASGERQSLDEAFVSAWISVATAPPPVQLAPGEVELHARRADKANAPEAARVLRAMLIERTGERWSCTAGRGRERFHLRVCAPKSRWVNGGMRASDRVTLASIFGGRPGRDGILIGPERGRRFDAVMRAGGHDGAANDVLAAE